MLVGQYIHHIASVIYKMYSVLKLQIFFFVDIDDVTISTMAMTPTDSTVQLNDSTVQDSHKQIDEDQHCSSNLILYQAIAACIIIIMAATIVVLSVKCHKLKNTAQRTSRYIDVGMMQNRSQQPDEELYEDLSGNQNEAYEKY